MDRLTGAATPAGTRRFAERAVRDRRLPAEHFRTTLGGLTLSTIGLGTYIGPPDAATDLAVDQAVTICVTSGRVNVLDTAINYRHQRAERSVGRALGRLVEGGEVTRDEVFVASKNGYLAPDGESRLAPDRWVDEELVRPGILDPADIVDGHAMSVRFLADQLERTLANLRLECLDLLYLHNAADAQLPHVGPDSFFDRLEAVFRFYERERDRGRIRAYGFATWDCLLVAPGDPRHCSLEQTVRLARKVGGEDHGFRFVQFPFNVAMPAAAVASTQVVDGAQTNVFAAARRLGLGCFTSVPLLQGQLARAGPKRNGLTSAQTALQFARSAPGNLGPLVGQKRSEHLSENLEVAAHPPWPESGFASFLG